MSDTTSQLTISAEDYKAIGDCKVGDKLSCTATVTSMNEDGSAVADVDQGSLAKEETDTGGAAADEGEGEPMPSRSPAVKAVLAKGGAEY